MIKVRTLFCIALLLSLPLVSRANETALHEGMLAPDWMLTDIEGHSYSLYRELEAGNQVAIVFWSTWCKFCKELLPELNLFKQTLDDSARIFAFNIWETNDPVAYFDTRKIDLPLFLNADSIADRYNIKATPGIVFIGADKKIRYIRKPGDTLTATMKKLQWLMLEDKFPKAASGG